MPRGSKPKQYADDLVATVKALYAQGKTQEEIGSALGLSQKVIWRLMMRHRIPARIAAKRDQRGPKNSSWRGATASYSAFHFRVERLRGKPQRCEECGVGDPGQAYDWANLSGRYDDTGDYKRLCRSCHWKLDSRHKNLGNYAERRILCLGR